jgi:MerR family transcriptional regulator, thiopeptide resistance regulator
MRLSGFRALPLPFEETAMPRKSADAKALGRAWKVGELAERTGLTVRTLHHYDALGLLSPSGRTDSTHQSGHRLYTDSDVARLQQIVSLKQLGFSLDQVQEYLARGDYDPRRVVRLHLARIRGQAENLRRLEEKLGALADALDKAEIVSADEFLTTIEEMTMIEKYYTPDQLASLQKRAEEAGDAGAEMIREGPQRWAQLHADLQAAMDAGVQPTDPQARELANRWFALVSSFTGGDPSVFLSLKRMYQNEDTIHGMNAAAMRPGMEWMEKAAAAAGIKLPTS